MTASEVFRALHAALEPGQAGDLQTLFDDVNGRGFGPLREDTILRCVLAVRGGDPYRSFEQEFDAGDNPETTFSRTAATLEHVFEFLRVDGAVPHVRALPYPGVLPILARFFALHPHPEPRTRNLLRRWLWRGSMAWGRDVGALRNAVRDVNDDEHQSIEALLHGVDSGLTPHVDLNAVQLNKASARLNVALMASLTPLHLEDASPVDVRALLDADGPGALLDLTGGMVPGLAARVLHPEMDPVELLALFERASSGVLDSHAIDPQALASLIAGDFEAFARQRGHLLGARLNEQRRRLAEPAASDRPSIASLVIPPSNE